MFNPNFPVILTVESGGKTQLTNMINVNNSLFTLHFPPTPLDLILLFTFLCWSVAVLFWVYAVINEDRSY